ncbi:hypothetical protein [Hymenobacter sp. CRA2]|uniref:hypothetical protein n=1 Tax=Hymenobacter sp. CRA2 TaxID=1955620 RepID=UPI00098FD928|nr:hypothetical protein [Hymenobacter sp. CRA2]OON67773.1 hypothetical protein B0919_16390 [Hymenobacter sp. CRA2]
MSSQWLDLVAQWQQKAAAAQEEAHRVLAVHEGAVKSRVIVLEDVMRKLTASPLPSDVQDYFREAITCLEHDARRAAIVLSWAGFFYTICEKLYSQHEAALRMAYPNWQFTSFEELKETYNEFQLIEAMRKVSLISKPEMRQFQGLLAQRNQCAHPTRYQPSMNEALGFVSQVLDQAIRHL